MRKLTKRDVVIPADVPRSKIRTYMHNYLDITHGTGRLMLFAGDQKIEHLNKDFFGEITVEGKKQHIPLDDSHPEHLFKIASAAKIGCFATQLGMIARYGRKYRKLPYLVKLNSKTNLVKSDQQDPLSNALWEVDQVAAFARESRLHIVGVGYTVYLGSEFEEKMLKEAAQVVHRAHQHGLVTVLWMYPRGAAVKDEKDPHLIAGAAGVACCLGTDFAKVNYPVAKEPAKAMREATLAGGNVGVVTAGGGSKGIRHFLQQTWDQIHIAGCVGNATGRNIHQKSLHEAVRLANAVSAITLADATVDQAMAVYEHGRQTQ